MSIADDRDRAAGRFNLIDGLVAALILIMIPVAYGSYLLFRTPPARLTSVEPSRLYQGKNLRVVVQGENLRPFMRVSFSTIQGRSFLIGSTTSAQVDLPDLEPGVYDVQLFDYQQEVSSLPKALTVLPLAPVPSVVLEVEGSFAGLPADLAASFAKGTIFASTQNSAAAEVLSIGPVRPARLRVMAGDNALDLPIAGQNELTARLKVPCYIASNPDGTVRCMVNGPQQASTVVPNAILTLAGPRGWVNFQVTRVLPPSPAPAPASPAQEPPR
jgi:hypothetical protein